MGYSLDSTRSAPLALRLPVGPRAIGIGEAYVGVSDDVFGINWNPAGLAFTRQIEIQAQTSFWLAQTNYEAIGYLQPLPTGAIGASFQYLHMGELSRINDSELEGKFKVYDGMGSLAYGISPDDILGFGVAIKGFQTRLADEKGDGFAFDIGFLWKPTDIFSFGIVGQNIGSKMKYIDMEEDLPQSLKLGFAWNLELPGEAGRLCVLVDGTQVRDNEYIVGGGIEHWGLETLAIRLGYKYDTVDDKLGGLKGLRAGFGVRTRGILVDYAYAPYGDLGVTHHVSVGYRFGEIKELPKPSVVISANPFIISPDGDDINEKTKFTISGENFVEISEWEFMIKDKDNRTIRAKKGTAVPSAIYWEGTDNLGNKIEDGQYFGILKLTQTNGKVTTSIKETVVVDKMPPRSAILINPQEFSPNGDDKDDTVTITMDAVDNSRLSEWSLEIRDEKGNQVKTFEGKGEVTPKVVWDGKDDYYGKVVFNGNYFATLVCKDIAGNVSETDPQKIVLNVIPITEELEVKEEERGLVISLSSQVLFDSGQSTLKPEAYKSIKEVIKLLNAYPGNRVSIEGHTDSVGSASYNLKLSRKRAKSVYTYLVNAGVDSKRLVVVGHGESNPVASNNTEEGKRLNRRVEIIILRSEVEEEDSKKSD